MENNLSTPALDGIGVLYKINKFFSSTEKKASAVTAELVFSSRNRCTMLYPVRLFSDLRQSGSKNDSILEQRDSAPPSELSSLSLCFNSESTSDIILTLILFCKFSICSTIPTSHSHLIQCSLNWGWKALANNKSKSSNLAKKRCFTPAVTASSNGLLKRRLSFPWTKNNLFKHMAIVGSNTPM